MCSDSATCLRCGYRCNSSNPEAGATLSSTTKGDITSVLGEIQKLDDLIHHLRNERACLQRQLNDLRSHTNMLPYEIVSTIFRYACLHVDHQIHSFRTNYALKYPYEKHTADLEGTDSLTPIVLGAVCVLWRQIAWSTNDLWTSFTLEIKENKIQHQENLLLLYFQNSGNFPVSLELDFRDHISNFRHHSTSTKMGSDALAPIHAVILRHAPKVQSLRLSAVPPEWVASLNGTFTSLESLSLGWPTTEQIKSTQELSLADILALRRVKIWRLWAPLKLPWSQIVVLDLDRMTIDTCVELLIECRNLEEYSVREPSFTPSDRRHPSLNGIITLDSLKVLVWTCLPDAWSIAMLEHVRFSRLMRLEWHGFPGDQNRNRFRDFFSDLPPTLQTLGLSRYHDSSDGLQDILMSIPQLICLELLACQSRFCQSILHYLTPPLSLESYDQLLLPSLKHLAFNHCDEMHQFGTKGSLLFKALFSMLHLRFTTIARDQGGLILQFRPHVKWRSDAQHVMTRLAHEGVIADILEESKTARWI